MERQETLPLTVPVQRDDAAGTDSRGATAASLRLRATLGQLCRSVVEEVENGGQGNREIALLHVWLRADFVPWTSRMMLELTLSRRSCLAATMARVGELDAQLPMATGAQAADVADQLRRHGTDLVAEIVADGKDTRSG